jgi:sugar transferase (PEP-CTERM/EpsH1 system associated)
MAHRIPYPPNKGDKIRSYNILKHLARQNEIHLATLIDDPKDRAYLLPLSKIVKSLIYDTIEPRTKRVTSAVSILRSSPISVSYFYSRSVQKAVDDLLGKLEFDAVFCSSSPMAEYLFNSVSQRGKAERPLLLMDLIDVDSHKWRQYAETSSWMKRWIFDREARYLADYEERIAKEFDHVILVTEQEKRLLLKRVPASNVSVVSNGVDLHHFSPGHAGKMSKQGPVIVFTGVMDYWPNVEGVDWFAKRVFPKVKRVLPGAAFYIVGSRPAAEVQKLARIKGVRVTGYVEDTRDYLAVANACVVPLRIARGIQNKVLEAMAMGKPVVTTSQVLEGVDAVSDWDVVKADGEDAFSRAVIDLLKNRSKAETIGRNARFCVEQKYSWEKRLCFLQGLLTPNASLA